MLRAIKGSKVKIQYIGRHTDGSVFNPSEESDSIEFTIGKREIIKGLEDAVIGMSIGDKRNITINPNNGYGPYREDLIFEYEKEKMPENIELKVGKRISTRTKSRKEIVKMTIIEISDKYVTLDANHPLAGKTLTFEIELIELESNLN